MGIVKRQSIKGVATYILGAGLHFFTTLVIMNRFLPEEYFAAFRNYFAIITIFGYSSLLGINIIVFKYIPLLRNENKDTSKLNFITLMSSILTAGILVFFMYYFRKPITDIYKPEGNLVFPLYYFCVPIGVFFSGLLLYFETYSIATHRLTAPAMVREILQRGILLLATLGYWQKWWGIETFFLLFGLSYAICVLVLCVYCVLVRDYRLCLVRSWNEVKEFRENISYALYTFGVTLLGIFMINVDQNIAYKLLSDLDVSTYGMALIIASMITIPYKPISAILIPFMYEAWEKKDYDRLNEISIQSSINLTAIGVLLLCILWINIPNYFHSGLCEPKYFGLSIPLLILALGRILDYGSGASSEMIISSPSYKRLLTYLAISSIFTACSMWFLCKHYGYIGLAIGVCVQYVIYNGLKYYDLKKYYGIQAYPKNVLNFIGLGMVLLAINHFIPYTTWYIDLVIRTGILSIAYLAFIYKMNWLPDLNLYADKLLKKS